MKNTTKNAIAIVVFLWIGIMINCYKTDERLNEDRENREAEQRIKQKQKQKELDSIASIPDSTIMRTSLRKISEIEIENPTVSSYGKDKRNGMLFLFRGCGSLVRDNIMSGDKDTRNIALKLKERIIRLQKKE